MRTESIRTIVESLLGKKDNYTAEELNSIDTLVVSRADYDNRLLSVDFNDLLNFKNLVSLKIDGCSIDNETMTIISKLPMLNELSLFNCVIGDDIYEIFRSLNIRILRIENTNFDLEYLDRNYERIVLSGVHFKRINGQCDELDISNCAVNDLSLVIDSNVKTVIVSKAQYLNHEELFNNCNKKIIVMESNGQFIFKEVGF